MIGDHHSIFPLRSVLITRALIYRNLLFESFQEYLCSLLAYPTYLANDYKSQAKIDKK